MKRNNILIWILLAIFVLVCLVPSPGIIYGYLVDFNARGMNLGLLVLAVYLASSLVLGLKYGRFKIFGKYSKIFEFPGKQLVNTDCGKQDFIHDFFKKHFKKAALCAILSSFLGAFLIISFYQLLNQIIPIEIQNKLLCRPAIACVLIVVYLIAIVVFDLIVRKMQPDNKPNDSST